MPFIYFPIIQNDVYLEQKINANKEKAEEYIRKYQLENKKILLYVGRFDPVKNIPLLLNAYAEIKNDEMRLVLVGDGEMKPTVREKIKKLNIENEVYKLGLYMVMIYMLGII